MPIRFRCAYCNQLMGISTRKAGTVVRCPKCAGEIIVPVPEGADAPPEPPPPPPPPQPVAPAFEAQNFEQMLTSPSNGPAAAPTETVRSGPTDLAAPTLPPIPAPPPRRLGLFLPLGMLIVSFVVIVLLMILMLVLGLIIGRHTIIEAKTAANSSNSPPFMAGGPAPPAINGGLNESHGCPLRSGNVKNPHRNAWSCT